MEKKMLISNSEKQEITNLIFNKKFEGAKNQVNQLIKKYPKEYILFNFLGAIFAEQNNLEQAIEYYEKSIKLNSRYAEAYSNLGSLFEKSGQYEKAEENLNMALKLNPNLVAAYNNLGTLLGGLEEYEKGNAIMGSLVDRYENDLRYYVSLKGAAKKSVIRKGKQVYNTRYFFR